MKHHLPGANDLNPRNNNFGFIRLLLATLVIVSHAPELADGNRHRELLTKAFGTLSFGMLAVDGFFLLSGYLIVKSWESDPHLRRYLEKRVLRIYPGFLVASAVSVLIVGRISETIHANSLEALKRLVLDAVRLRPPGYPTPLAYKHWAALNGAMWTVQWEFKCYITVAIIGFFGFVPRKWTWPALAALALLATTYHDRHGVQDGNAALIAMARFGAMFASGATFYLFRDRIPYTRPLAAGAGVGMIASLFIPAIAQSGVALFGGYLLFAFAFATVPLIAHIGTRNDLSYGLYLYAWPVQQLLLLYVPSAPIWMQALGTLVFSCIFGFMSWRLVEKPSLRFKPGQRLAKVARKDSVGQDQSLSRPDSHA